ncbi:hypothetical protein VIGAN_08355500 [Vigna angularis var. angularis]|uniref:Uncharacterized protein n=1 Tax=Vigna angularis var. angularis TaxID=157739 RepID=A0A0S3SUP8_PHAAN|nr:hypothetical protein VIGAN_08355500 [Vigna angularis var. angularis]
MEQIGHQSYLTKPQVNLNRFRLTMCIISMKKKISEESVVSLFEPHLDVIKVTAMTHTDSSPKKNLATKWVEVSNAQNGHFSATCPLPKSDTNAETLEARGSTSLSAIKTIGHIGEQ